MTGSSENNMASVAHEVNQAEVDFGKNFRVLPSNDQIKGKACTFSQTFVNC